VSTHVIGKLRPAKVSASLEDVVPIAQKGVGQVELCLIRGFLGRDEVIPVQLELMNLQAMVMMRCILAVESQAELAQLLEVSL